jgi:hypothetical protein
MGMILYYVRNGSCGMDKHGRWTDNARQWEVYSRRDKAMDVIALYPESTLGIL